MMWSDKAFSIWMGHAGEESELIAPDEAVDDAWAHRPRAAEIARKRGAAAGLAVGVEIWDRPLEQLAGALVDRLIAHTWPAR